MKCPNNCGEMFAGELLWVCGWCGKSVPRQGPQPAPPPQMITIPAGEFLFGSPDTHTMAALHERPWRQISLDAYQISKYPVTNDQYRIFVEDKKYHQPDHWQAQPPVGENSQHPVCFVSWIDAQEYCVWLSVQLKKNVQLPTEAQWEKAARGGYYLDEEKTQRNPFPERIFPHGNEPLSAQHANFGGIKGGTTPVGSFPAGASPYGCMDMVGNVSEWCRDTYAPGYYSILPQNNPCNMEPGEKKSLRGGSWRSEMAHARCSNRYFYRPEDHSYGIGFRVVIEEPPS